MKQRKVCAVCTAAVMGATITLGTTAMAKEESIAIPYGQESAWDELAMTNDDTVDTGINIRSRADDDSEVIGYMYHGGAAWVINRGEEWTEIYSGGLTGFVKNEYLVYGRDVTGLADHYGTEGVATTWDDVKLYSGNDGASDVLHSLSSGDSFILTGDEGHWLQVQNGADNVAYVSSDDVSRVLLLSTAVAKDAVYNGPRVTSGNVSYASESDTAAEEKVSGQMDASANADTEENYSGEISNEISYAEENYDEGSYSEETYDDGSYSEGGESYDDSSYSDNNDSQETWEEPSYSEEEASGQETYTETEAPAAQNTSGIGSYDASTNTYYDVYGNYIYSGSTQLGYYDENTGNCYDVNGNMFYNAWTGTFSGASEETYTEQTEASVQQTEAPDQTEAAETGTQSANGIGSFDASTNTYYDVYGNYIYSGSTQLGYYDESTGNCYDVNGTMFYNAWTGVFTDSAEGTSSEQTEAAPVQTEAYAEETEASSPATSASADDTSLLAALIYCEAGNQSFDGMVAVGAVVLNRVYSSSFPNTIRGVIYESGQFTPAYSGALDSALANGVPSTCYDAAVAALNGQNPVGGALYFNTGSGKGVKLGDHQFY